MAPSRLGRTPGVDSDPVVDIAGLYAAHRLPLVRLAVLLVDDVASAEDVVAGRPLPR